MRPVRVALCPAIVLCALLVSAAIAAADEAQPTSVKVLDMLLTEEGTSNAKPVKAYKAGLKAALWWRGDKVAGGLNLERVEVRTSGTAEDVPKAIRDAVKKNPDAIAVLGPVGDQTLMYALPALKENNLVALGPYTGSSTVRFWEPHFYFLRTEPMNSLSALIWYATVSLRVRRLGFMYLTDVMYGDDEHDVAVDLLASMGYELCGVFKLSGKREWTETDTEFQEEWEKFAETRPQSVIILGSPSRTLEAFVDKMLTDSRTTGVYLLSLTGTQDVLVERWKKAVNEGLKPVDGLLITRGATPFASDKHYTAISRFRTEMKKYLEETKEYDESEHFLNDVVDGELMVGGWVAGNILAQIFASTEWLKSRDVFASSLFNQRRYVVDDMIIGDYGGECNDLAISQGAICNCNQGGRTSFLKTFGEDFQARPIESGDFTYPLQQCYVSRKTWLTPISAVAFQMEDDDVGLYVSEEMVRGVLAALPPPSQRTREFTLEVLSGKVDTLADALEREREERHVHVFMGPVVPEVLESSKIPLMDPIALTPSLRVLRPNVFYLSPTFAQEFFVLVGYVSRLPAAPVHAVMRGDTAEDILGVLRRTLVTFGLQLKSTALLKADASLDGVLPQKGWVFLIGVDARVLESVLSHVSANPDVRVLMCSAEHNLLYPLLSALSVDAATDRILFATNLPHWADSESDSTLLKRYHAAVEKPWQRSPLSLTGFLASSATMAVAGMMGIFSWERFTQTIFSRSTITVDDMLYGPFRQVDPAWCPDISDPDCFINYGATNISVWSLSRSLDHTIPALSEPETPSMRYVDPDEGKLTLAQLAGIILGSLTAVLLLVVPLFTLLHRRGARDNHNAPKEPTDPVTLVFTDIESSTALWAVCPEIMPDAIATHHRLIRSLIAKYRCYEVKTIGDSFMIASRSASAAVQLVRDLQQLLLQHDWGTSAIDDSYHAFEEDRAAEDEGYVPPTARLDDAVYRQLWNGVRVRAGLHTGLCSIRHDEVTKGYDYYGGTSNMAARTESVANGGQVLLTRAAYLALSTAEREQLAVTALGAVALRGVPKPVEMYQLDAVPGRSFAALRLDRISTEYDGDCVSMSTDGCSETLTVLSGEEYLVTDVLNRCFSSLLVAERVHLLRRLCGRWGVRVVRQVRGESSEDYCKRLVYFLAMKVAPALSGASKRVSLALPNSGKGAWRDAAATLCCVEGCDSSYSSTTIEVCAPFSEVLPVVAAAQHDKASSA